LRLSNPDHEPFPKIPVVEFPTADLRPVANAGEGSPNRFWNIGLAMPRMSWRAP